MGVSENQLTLWLCQRNTKFADWTNEAIVTHCGFTDRPDSSSSSGGGGEMQFRKGGSIVGRMLADGTV